MLLVANFKAHLVNLPLYVEAIKKIPLKKVDVWLAPPFPYLQCNSPFPLVAQDVSAKTEGAYTGEVTASMLKDLCIPYALIGHSERRKMYHETTALLKEKYLRLKECGIEPILCVGETQEEHNRGSYLERIVQEIETISENASNPWIAYEPIWAIGTGQTPSIETLLEMMDAVRHHFHKARFLYGGSVNAQNCSKIAAVTDGLLIGSASNDINKFIEILQQLEQL